MLNMVAICLTIKERTMKTMKTNKFIALVMCLIMCISTFTTLNISAREEFTLPSAVVIEYGTMDILYLKGDGTLWSYNEDGNNHKKLLDDVIYAGKGTYSMNFIAIQSDGSLWSMNVNYQDNFEKSMDNIACAASTSFQDFANFAVTKDGQLYSWGSTGMAPEENCMGFAGYDGKYIEASDARKILDGVDSVFAHTFNAAALKNDGTLWHWGKGQDNPKKIADSIKSITQVTPDAIFALTKDNSLGAWHYVDEIFFYEPSLIRDVKKAYIADKNIAYIDLNNELWVGYATEDFGETHFGKVFGGVKDVAVCENTTISGNTPVLVIKNDNSLWASATFNVYNDYIPEDDEFEKIMDNVDSVSTEGTKCSAITRDGKLYTFNFSEDSGKVTGLREIAQLSDPTPSDWAKPETDRAINLGLVSEEMQKDYKANISRVDFCKILTRTIEAKTGKEISQLLTENGWNTKKNFIDIDSEYVDYMCRMGIVSGTSDILFDPYAKITREAAAVMLMRTAKALGYDTSATPSTEPGVSSWAKDGVGFVTAKGIMNGTGNGFDPQGKYTKEQAIATFVRMIDNLK